MAAIPSVNDRRRFTQIFRIPGGRHPVSFRTVEELIFSAPIHNLSPEEYFFLWNNRCAGFLMLMVGRLRGKGNNTPLPEMLEVLTYVRPPSSRIELNPPERMPDWARQEYEEMTQERDELFVTKRGATP
ncbi:MAG: hypothetical protein Q8O37_03030 [Sulfuricellaceae bacterium]|nr:hypothetical protein [Sulfuricellaceae bacterium]